VETFTSYFCSDYRHDGCWGGGIWQLAFCTVVGRFNNIEKGVTHLFANLYKRV